VSDSDDRARVEAKPEDVGDQALMSFVKWFRREISSPCDFRWSER
jgi:hypothetical protein